MHPGREIFFRTMNEPPYQNLFLPFKVRLGHNMAIIPLRLVWVRARQLGPLTRG